MTKNRNISYLLNSQPKGEMREIARRAEELGKEIDSAWRTRVRNRLKDNPTKGKCSPDDIIDYKAIESIFAYYLMKDYREVIWGIKCYGEFEFFHDMAIYLYFRYNSQQLKLQTYEFFIDLYYN